jgi:DNA polymerase-3 subunit beta
MKTAMIDVRALAAISHAAGTEQVRYYLNGVCVEIDQDGATYVATDGHMLAATRREYAGENVGAQLVGRWIIPTTICQHFKIAKRAKRPDQLAATLSEVEGGKLALEYDGQSVVFSPIDGAFPEWRRVLPGELSGDVAQFGYGVLGKLAKVAKALGNDRPALAIAHNGLGPALVNLGGDDEAAFGVIMPFRGAAPECLPAWVHHVPEEMKIAAE